MTLKFAAISLWILLFLLPYPSSVGQTMGELAKAKPISLVANDWCPQHCLKGEWKGYVVDIVEAALKAEGLPFEISYQPWLRALREVQAGKKDGLLTPTVPGFPQFLYHEEAVGYQEYCIYSNRSSKWSYHTNSDLLGKRLAYLEESGFGSLDDYIAKHSQKIVTTKFTGDDNYPGRIFQFLSYKRTDAVIITSDVYEFSVKRKEIPDEFAVAGCLGKEKMAVGLTKVDEKRSRLIGKALDHGIRTLRKSGQLQAILTKYGLIDWNKAE